MKNKKIRIALIETGLHVYELAELLHTSESTVTRMMRQELPADEQNRIAGIIRQEGARRNGSSI